MAVFGMHVWRRDPPCAPRCNKEYLLNSLPTIELLQFWLFTASMFNFKLVVFLSCCFSHIPLCKPERTFPDLSMEQKILRYLS